MPIVLTIGIFFDKMNILIEKGCVLHGKYKYEYQDGCGSKKAGRSTFW